MVAYLSGEAVVFISEFSRYLTFSAASIRDNETESIAYQCGQGICFRIKLLIESNHPLEEKPKPSD